MAIKGCFMRKWQRNVHSPDSYAADESHTFCVDNEPTFCDLIPKDIDDQSAYSEYPDALASDANTEWQQF